MATTTAIPTVPARVEPEVGRPEPGLGGGEPVLGGEDRPSVLLSKAQLFQISVFWLAALDVRDHIRPARGC